MKLLVVLISFLGFVASAQSVDVKGVEASGDTTIQIKKGAHGNTENQFEIINSNDEITGDPAPLLKDARDNWKKACNEWKKETKDLNKENQIISMTCGRMECSTVAMESTCRSQSTHKVKVKMK